MKDSTGQILNVGDKVAYVTTFSGSGDLVHKGHIQSIKGSTAEVKFKDEVKLISPSRLVRLEDGELDNI